MLDDTAVIRDPIIDEGKVASLEAASHLHRPSLADIADDDVKGRFWSIEKRG